MPGVRPAGVFPVVPLAVSNLFLKETPRTLLFPQHDDAEVRKINLRDIYAATIQAINHLIRFSSHIAALEPILEYEPPGTLERHLLTGIARLETCLNPNIACSPYLQPIKNHLAARSLELMRLELAQANVEDVFACFQAFQPLERIKASLSQELRSRIEVTQKALLAKLRRRKALCYISFHNPIEARRLAGKTLGGKKAWQAWSEWYGQMLAIRSANLVGLKDANVATLYRQSIDELENLSFCKSYGAYLLDAVKYLAFSMTDYHTIAYEKMPYRQSADQLALYGINLFNRIEDGERKIHDPETSAEFLVAIYKGLGLGYQHDQNVGRLVYRLLELQLPDGSWETDPLPNVVPENQAELLERMYRITCACILGLVPLRNDILHPANRALGLI
jgi:hypothetical protein